MAMLATHVSACAGGLSWMVLEWILKGKPSVLGTVSGAVAGLVVVTPGSGFVDHFGALLCGISAGPVCYFGIQIKHMCGFDDALDAFGVHGVGGIWGGIMTGLLANPAIAGESGAFYGNGRQLGIQIAGIVTTMAYSFVMTLLIIIPLDFLLKAIRQKVRAMAEKYEGPDAYRPMISYLGQMESDITQAYQHADADDQRQWRAGWQRTIRLDRS